MRGEASFDALQMAQPLGSCAQLAGSGARVCQLAGQVENGYL